MMCISALGLAAYFVLKKVVNNTFSNRFDIRALRGVSYARPDVWSKQVPMYFTCLGESASRL